MHFKEKHIRDANSWAGELDEVPFHVYTMKEPDCIMSLMSTYRTNEIQGGKEAQRERKEHGVRKMQQ